MQSLILAWLTAFAMTTSLCACQSDPKGFSVSPAPNVQPAVQAAQPMEESQALLNGNVFDEVWVIIRDTHLDPSLSQTEWNETRIRFRDRAVAATDADSFRTVLRDMLQTLGESHFAIIPNSVSGSSSAVGGWSGLTVQVLGGDAIVTRIAEKSPAEIAGIKTGWKLVSSEGGSIDSIIKAFGTPRTSLERLAREQAVSAFVGGRPGMSEIYLFVDSNGRDCKNGKSSSICIGIRVELAQRSGNQKSGMRPTNDRAHRIFTFQCLDDGALGNNRRCIDRISDCGWDCY